MGSLPSTFATAVMGPPEMASESSPSPEEQPATSPPPTTTSPTSTQPTTEHQKWPLGTKIQKHFAGHGAFTGKVESFEDGLYHIVYSDGDAEDFDDEDMEQYVLYRSLPTMVTPPPSMDKKEDMETPSSSHSRKRLKLEDGTAAAVTVTPQSTATVATSFGALHSKDVPVHTLIVGTYPAMESIAQGKYFSKPTNAFWWIAGDCLGFRRDGGELSSMDGDLRLCEHLRFGKEHSIPYQQQVDIFCSKGFALWDVLATCKRKGSLDSSIQRGSDVPNDIRGFINQHPSIRRIIFASGKSTARYFNTHFKDWWASGELTYSGDHPYSVEMFANMMFDRKGNEVVPKNDAIVCVVAKSVSPAEANATYLEKRQFWEDHVYAPGLEMHFAQAST